MSGAQTSTFPTMNEMLAPMEAYDTHAVRQNQLLQQQQEISGHEIEMGARLAGALWSSYPTPEARAAAYPGFVARARAQFPGYFKSAPDTYPGDEATQTLMRLGTPSADLIKLGLDRTAKDAIAPSGGGGTGGGGTGGGAAIGGDFETRLTQAESGGRPNVINEQGYTGAYQFGKQRLADLGYYTPAPSEDMSDNRHWAGRVSIPGFNVTDQQSFANNLAAQRVAFSTHIGNIDQAIAAIPGADRYDQNGLRAVAHLGGVDGMRRFVASGGAYNPADANGITLSAYYTRFSGGGGQPGARTATTGAPGSPQAPGVVTGDVGRPGDVPPPPGGAPGGYQATGGGFGSVIGGQPAAVRATIPAGRPTGPPVITDQPAGGGVVAGPPGTAVVGQALPPSPAVAGNVDAINRGIVGAGGTAATDPNLTPTPARYAGTAPAPSVEAAPEPGWGTGIGSGYGPQNTLAPPPPQPPARPATPAAQQPPAPAADTLPPLPAPTPPERRNSNGLTDAQQQDINRLRPTSMSSEHLQAKVDAYRTANDARAEKYQADQLAYAAAVQARQTAARAAGHQTLEEQRQAEATAATTEQRRIENARAAEAQQLAQEAAQRARAKEDREAVEANKPFHGNTPDAQNRNILIEGTNSGKTDTTEYQSAYADYATEKVDANGLRYRPDMKPYATPTGKTYGKGEGGRELGKADVGQGPLPPPPIMTSMLRNNAGLRNISSALRKLQAYPDAVGVKGALPNFLLQRVDPEGVTLRADIGDILSQVFHDRSGAAVMVSEAQRMKPFVPDPTDSAASLQTKLQRMQEIYRNTLIDHYSAYGPDGGGRRLPAVEKAIISSLPDAAVEYLKKNPGTGADFDKKYGMDGLAQMVLGK